MNNDDRQKIGFYAVPILLSLYTIPIIAFYVLALFGMLTGDNSLGKGFVVLVAAPDNPLSFIQSALLPVTAGVTVATMWDARHKWWTTGMIGLSVLCLAASILLWFWIAEKGELVRQLWEPANVPAAADSKTFANLATAYLTGIAKTVLTYLLVLLGLQTIPPRQG